MAENNFLFLFFSSSLFLGICSLFFYKIDVLQPAVLMTMMMAFSAFMAWLMIDQWVLPFTFSAWSILTAALLMFTGGCISSSLLAFPHAIPCKENDHYTFCVKRSLLILSCLVMFILSLTSTVELYKDSILFGNTAGVLNTVKVIRPLVEAQKYSLSRWMNYRQYVGLAIAGIYAYMFLYQIVSRTYKKADFQLLIPVLLYIPMMILTTGRMAMMTFGIMLLTITIVLYQKKHAYSLHSGIRTCLFLSLAGVLILSVFLIMGYATGKVPSLNRTPLMILSHYAGLSLPAFSEAINSVTVDSGYVGSSFLPGIYRILHQLGFTVPKVVFFLPFVKFNGIDTNVYTAEWRYFKDLGFFGMCFIMWLLGFSYSLFYNFIKFNRLNDFLLIVYASMAFPLFLSSIDERFFLDIVGTTVLYQIVLFWLAYYFILKKSRIAIT